MPVEIVATGLPEGFTGASSGIFASSAGIDFKSGAVVWKSSALRAAETPLPGVREGAGASGVPAFCASSAPFCGVPLPGVTVPTPLSCGAGLSGSGCCATPSAPRTTKDRTLATKKDLTKQTPNRALAPGHLKTINQLDAPAPFHVGYFSRRRPLRHQIRQNKCI